MAADFWPAMDVAQEELSAASWEDTDVDWDCVVRVLSEMALADMASKAEILQKLSSFLSCVATTMSFSKEHHSVSAWVGASQVFLESNEVSQLHELVFGELKNLTCFLFETSSTLDKQMDESADVNLTRILYVELVSQALRCCIRILPLVHCFDERASLTNTKLLDDLLQPLCYPTKLSDLLGLTARDDMHSGRSCSKAQCDEDGTWFETTGPHAPFQNSPREESNLIAMDSRHRKELIFAILEVFVDELLLRPGEIARLLSAREHTCSLVQEQVSCCVSHIEASLEAAFVHVLLSLHSLPGLSASKGERRKGLPACNLSLPAGLMLLEKFSGEGVPPFYIAHVVRLLSSLLNDATPLGFNQFDKLRRTRRDVARNCRAGGVDWSYCSRDRMTGCYVKDTDLYTKAVNSEATLNFASSILEQAIILYMRVSLASEPCTDNTRSNLYHTVENSALKFCLSKYVPLFDIFSESVKVNKTDVIGRNDDIEIERTDSYRDGCQFGASDFLNTQSDFVLEPGNGPSGYAEERLPCGAGIHCTNRKPDGVFKKDDTNDSSGLVAALLHLMSSTLECIGREVCKLTWLPQVFGDQCLNGQTKSAAEFSETDFDKILECVGHYLSLCLPPITSPWSMFEGPRCRRAGGDGLDSRPVVCAHRPLKNLVGQAVIVFANILRGEVQKGAPDGVLEEYFHLLESLVALLLVLDERNDSRQPALECVGSGSSSMLSDNMCRNSLEVFRYKNCSSCPPYEDDMQQLTKANITMRFLEEMVLSLQGMLEDLSKQQRSMPEFLLFFVFKQVSTSEGLSLVAMAFSICLQRRLDVQKITFLNTEIFCSGGFLTDILDRVFSEPIRSSTLLMFIVYMIDVLEDLSPITDALSLSEITDPVVWYESIAYNLTLASQSTISEQILYVRNRKEHFFSFISKLGQGIERLFTEGTEAARWLSGHSRTMSESTWHRLTGAPRHMGTSAIAGHNSCREAWNGTGSFEKCISFLGQVDMLRKAVEDLTKSLESSLNGQLIPSLEKGRIFYLAVSGLLAGKRPLGFQWSLYPTEQNQQQFSVSEVRSHLQSISADRDSGCDHVFGQKEEVQPHAFQEAHHLHTEAKEIHDRGQSLATATIPTGETGDQVLHMCKGFASEERNLEQGKNVLDEQQEEFQDFSEKDDDGPMLSTAETHVSSSLATAEKLQNRSGTSLIAQELVTVAVGMGMNKPPPMPDEKKHCSSITSAIIKRLLQLSSSRKLASKPRVCNMRPVEVGELIPQLESTSGQKRVTSESVDDSFREEKFPASPIMNPFVDSMSEQDSSKEKFDDLRDFIVSKKGRDYSVWLKRRQKVRRRLYTKNFFRRRQEKKDLLHLLGK